MHETVSCTVSRDSISSQETYTSVWHSTFELCWRVCTRLIGCIVSCNSMLSQETINFVLYSIVLLSFAVFCFCKRWWCFQVCSFKSIYRSILHAELADRNFCYKNTDLVSKIAYDVVLLLFAVFRLYKRWSYLKPVMICCFLSYQADVHFTTSISKYNYLRLTVQLWRLDQTSPLHLDYKIMYFNYAVMDWVPELARLFSFWLTPLIL